MGAENQKEARPAQPSLVVDPEQEVYQISTQKLLPSLQRKGLSPQGAISMKERKTSMPRFGAVKEDEQSGSQTELKQARSATKMSVPFESPAKVAYPQCCVGYLQAQEEGRIIITGSAFVIHHKIALTCAHNCLKPDNKKEYPALYLCLRFDGEVIRYKIKKPHYLDAFLEGESLIKSENHLDFAVLELQKNVDENFGYLGLCFECNDITPSTVVTMMGYVSRGDSVELVRRESKVTAMSPKIFGFPSMFDEKMSGGPVFYLKDNEYYVFGVSLAQDPSSQHSVKGFKLYRYLYQTLNANFSKTIGHLNLKYRWVNDSKMEKVIKQKYQLVTDLILEGNRVGPEGVNHLVRAGWNELRLVNLTNNNLEDKGLQILCEGVWPKLEKLMLGNNAITAAGLQFLKNCKWTALNSLCLQENKLKNKGVELIINAPFKNLIELNLYQTLINWEGIKMIVEAGYSNLEILEIGANRVREEGAKWLAKGQWPDLHFLGLSEATITDAAVQHFKEANWPNLKTLDLSRNHLTQAGLEHLLRCNFKKLKDLSLRENKIAGKGFVAMVTVGWVQLEEVDIRWNSLTEGDKQNLKDFGKGFPKMKKIYI